MKNLMLLLFFISLGCGSTKKYEVEKLDLSGKNLKNLPKKIFKYKNLKTINLRSNKFREFPSQLSQLTYLENIYLSDNNIDSIPIEILQFKNLKVLDLEANKIRYFRDLTAMSSLKVISITHNPLKTKKTSIECLIPQKTEVLYGHEFPSIKRLNCKIK
ncbi:leucine-rich repeat domain-containing protein [Flavivirga abyssicola]|uniref:leucine-rich repeat domain-containing protein n=1 Tax=Flavivirga abyssicola TaxID=3063533 RepID=UPI0026E01579|nr:leucine-rich repeat domain-containing protein [Flavivirga sp. MEBiC07777]WVK12880.1 leucine-rich repeat domain-containing protein [Flavivirga sp. MEBiC07777]